MTNAHTYFIEECIDNHARSLSGLMRSTSSGLTTDGRRIENPPLCCVAQLGIAHAEVQYARRHVSYPSSRHACVREQNKAAG